MAMESTYIEYGLVSYNGTCPALLKKIRHPRTID
jgi:hypothetical protein